MTPPPLRLRPALVADYVSGRLVGGARRRFERWLSADAALTADVDVLRRRLAAAGPMPALAPPPVVWTRIAATIDALDTAAGMASLAPAAALAAAPTRPDAERQRLRRQLRRWQAAAVGSMAASAVLAVLLLRDAGRVPTAAPGPVAALTPSASARPVQPMTQPMTQPVSESVETSTTVVEGLLELPSEPSASWRLRIDASERVIAVQTIGRPSLDAGEDYELWWIVDDFMISLGLLPREGRWVQPLPRGLLEAGEPRLVVTREPAYGSPAHGPSGPVLASTPVWHRL